MCVFRLPCGHKCGNVPLNPMAANAGMFPLILWPQMRECSPYSVAANAGMFPLLCGRKCWYFPLPCGGKWHWHWLESSKVLWFFLLSLPCLLLGRRGSLMVWHLRCFNCTGGGDATSGDGPSACGPFRSSSWSFLSPSSSLSPSP